MRKRRVGREGKKNATLMAEDRVSRPIVDAREIVENGNPDREFLLGGNVQFRNLSRLSFDKLRTEQRFNSNVLKDSSR